MLKPSSPDDIIVVYIAVSNDPLLVHYASQFALTYGKYSPGCRHRVIVVCNGGPLAPKMKSIFGGVPCEFYPRVNDGGWDISAYLDVANKFDSKLQVCLGASVYFHRAGWLARLASASNQFGPGMYGCFSSNMVRPHLNTTAFAVDPMFLRMHPPVRNKVERYNLEHGPQSLWRRIRQLGGATKLVTWDGCWEPEQWREPENILWKGTQENCLVFCNHTDKWAGATPQVRERWTRGADRILV